MAPKTTPTTKEKKAKKLPVELTEEQRKRKDNRTYYRRIDAVEESKRREKSALYYGLAEYSDNGVHIIMEQMRKNYYEELATLQKKHEEEKKLLQQTWSDRRDQLETQRKRIVTALEAAKGEYIKETTRAIQRLRKRPPLTDEELSDNFPAFSRDLDVQRRLGLLPHTVAAEQLQHHGLSSATVDVEQTLRTAVTPILELAQSLGLPADIPAPRAHAKHGIFYYQWH